MEDASLVRFKQELVLCRQLSHPNIVRLYDIGAHEGRKFITMELLSGKSLRQIVKEGPEYRLAMGYLVQICAALEAVHRRGVIHRDVKVDNLFVTDERVVKLMDFGLAKNVNETQGATRSGFNAGTPGYMPPEQYTSFGDVTLQADLYALGIVAFVLLTGTRPFRHKLQSKLLELQLTSRPPPPSARNPKVPPALDALVLSLVEKEPERRPRSAREVSDKLKGILAG
jgi:serine/threonine protein kinase